MWTITLRLPHIWTLSAAVNAKRVKRLVREMRDACGLVSWDVLCRQRQWNFGERVFGDDAEELLRDILRWRGVEWLREQRERTGSQGHGHHLRPWRWEEQFCGLWAKQGRSCRSSANEKGCRDNSMGAWLIEIGALKEEDGYRGEV